MEESRALIRYLLAKEESERADKEWVEYGLRSPSDQAQGWHERMRLAHIELDLARRALRDIVKAD